jgi:topoisomerase-4 subunit A
VGKNIIHVAIFRKNDERTIYNVAYRDGKMGPTYVKRFAVTGITRDKDYDISQGTEGSEVTYFSENPNGEAEVLRVTLKPKPRIRNLIFEFDMAELTIKGRNAMGNILSKNEVHKIALKRKGESTLGGRKIWFEPEVLRINTDGRGNYLGEFQNDDQILVVCTDGTFYNTNYDLSNHYGDNILYIEKFNPEVVWSAAYFDAEFQFYYVKRFQVEASAKPQRFIGDHPKSYLVKMSRVDYPRLEVKFGGDDKDKEKLIVEVAEFIGVKGFKAKGKRLTTYQVAKIKELEPLIVPEVKQPEKEDENLPEKPIKSSEDDGQMSIF